MHTQYTAPWHRKSYDTFIEERLPAILAERFPLVGYETEEESESTRSVILSLEGPDGVVSSAVTAIPSPDDLGIISIDGQEIIVVPVVEPSPAPATFADYHIRCMGEWLATFVQARIGEPPPDLQWTPELIATWLPIDRWVREFLLDNLDNQSPEWFPVQRIDDRNWLASREHLRRVWYHEASGYIEKGQRGCVCPIHTPEGPNIGKALSVATGADIVDGHFVPAGDAPRDCVALTVAMVPLVEHDDVNRVLMGTNMMRQWEIPDNPEPALVQSGAEPDVPGFWNGRNLLTAYVSWGPDTFEDGLVISASCAERLATHSPIEPGDKLSNRHGQKGVVSRILPDSEMPHTPEGEPVEIICNFIGLHTRMNYGQVRECLLGRVARETGEPLVIPPYAAPSDDAVRKLMAEAGIADDGMMRLRDGSDGDTLAQDSLVGYVYWGVTLHRTADKLRTWETSPGGMRQGELEYYALRDVGAFAVIESMWGALSCESDNVRAGIVQAMSDTGKTDSAPTPTFTTLAARLAAAGVQAALTNNGLRMSLQAPTHEWTLALAQPVSHPWLGDHELTALAPVEGVSGFDDVCEANEHLKRTLSKGAPKALVARAAARLTRAATAYVDSLVSPRHLHLNGRVALSARSVIVPGGDLRTDQTELPEEICWSLFGPLVARELDENAVRGRTPESARVLDTLMADSWVVVNRAPTVSSSHMLAFHPVRGTSRAIRLHPFACHMMNADFDGDQTAVFLPLGDRAQADARDKLSLQAHLSRDPSLAAKTGPFQDAVWGLAWHSLTPEGRTEIADLAGEDLCREEGFVTRAAIASLLERMARENKVAEAFAVADKLTRLGFAQARRSGASCNPFAHTSMPSPTPPSSVGDSNWAAAYDDMFDKVVRETDYSPANKAAPQLLAIKSGARGNPKQLIMGLMCRIVSDEEGGVRYYDGGILAGMHQDSHLVYCVGARKGLADLVLGMERLTIEMRNACAARGFGVLSRAMRAENPAKVLARAAAAGEVDPLTAVDGRLLVGMPAADGE